MKRKTNKLLEEMYVETLNDIREAKTQTQEAEWQLKKLNALHAQIVKHDEIVVKKKELSDNTFATIAKLGVEVLAVGAPLIVESYWMDEGLKFEQTGVYISKTPRWLSGIMSVFRKK